MFKSISALSVLAGLVFAVTVGAAAGPEARGGSMKLVVTSASSAPGGVSTPIGLTITALDGSSSTRVELPRDTAGGALQLPLAAGLYAVEGSSSGVLEGEEPVMPVLSSPQLVVVAAGGVSTVHVRDVGLAELGAPGVAAFEAGLPR